MLVNSALTNVKGLVDPLIIGRLLRKKKKNEIMIK